MKKLLFSILILIVILLSSCEATYKKYKLSNGKIVICATSQSSYCGTYLGNCKDGHRYSCLTNLELIGEVT